MSTGLNLILSANSPVQRLPKVAGQAVVPSIMVSEYPASNSHRDAQQLERDFDYVQTIITTTRKLRSDYGLVKQKPRLFLSATDSGEMMRCLFV